MVQSLGVSERILIKLNISISFGHLKEVNPRWPLTDLDKERLNFAASVNLYGTLVHMKNTVQIDSEMHTIKISIYQWHENYLVSDGKV
jgi:hypothetical protein